MPVAAIDWRCAPNGPLRVLCVSSAPSALKRSFPYCLATLFGRLEGRLPGGRVRDFEEQGADHGRDHAQEGQPIEATGIAAAPVLDDADIPRTEKPAEIADRVDPGDRG